MKIILAPDSFKNSLSAEEVCSSLEAGLSRAVPDAEIISIPVADGGEGTARIITGNTGGNIHTIKVVGPLGDQLTAEYGICGDGKTGILEMASASGIQLVDREQLNPLKASTYGTGQIITALLDRGITDIVIGIGGSATVDGGAGMAQALGYKLLDKHGKEIPPGGGNLSMIADIDKSGINRNISSCSVKVACDVTNPLLGSNGAASVFGPQKGATPEMVRTLEQNLEHMAKILTEKGYISDCNYPGDGAAGGLGMGLRAFLGASIQSGADLVLDTCKFDEQLSGCFMVITGEGKTDSQTASGKLCAVVAGRARTRSIPVLCISGALESKPGELLDTFTAALSISRGPESLDDALNHTRENLQDMGMNIGKIISAFGK